MSKKIRTGKRIDAVRIYYGLNINQFSTFIGISDKKLQGIITNSVIPNKDVLITLIRKFGVNEDWIMDGKGNAFSSHIKAEIQKREGALNITGLMVKALRNKMRLSRKKFGKIIRVSEWMVSKLEHSRVVTKEYFVKVVSFTGIIPFQTIDVSPNMPSDVTNKDKLRKELGNILKELRYRSNLKQKDVADAIGTCTSNVCLLETGNSKSMSMELLVRIKKGLESSRFAGAINEKDVNFKDNTKCTVKESFQRELLFHGNNDVGKRIGDVRGKLNLTIEDMSSKVNFNSAYLKQVESGNISISANLVTALADKVNVDLNWLFTGSGEIFKCDDICLDRVVSKWAFLSHDDREAVASMVDNNS